MIVPLVVSLSVLLAAPSQTCSDGTCEDGQTALNFVQRSSSSRRAGHPQSQPFGAAQQGSISEVVPSLSSIKPAWNSSSPTGRSDMNSQLQSTSGSAREGRSPRNVAIFLDGTGNERGNPCLWGQAISPWPVKTNCDTNVRALYNMLPGDSDAQIKAYFQGVGVNDPFDYATGWNVLKIAYNAFKWLARNYQEGDKIYIFAFSRGTISARTLQGLIFTFGVPKNENYADAALAADAAVFSRNSQIAKFRDSGNSWFDPYIFLGFWDAVIASLNYIQVSHHHQALTPIVRKFYHAMALGEDREEFQGNELQFEPNTSTVQAWFAGVHSDSGGGYPIHEGMPDVTLAWMADAAFADGLLINANWKTEVKSNFAQAVAHSRRPYSNSVGSVRNTVRNPFRCRAEVFGQDAGPVTFHQSVKDKLDQIKGYVSPYQCCTKSIVKEEAEWGVKYVSNPTYEVQASPSRTTPQWVAVKLGKLQNAPRSAFLFTPYKFSATVQGWDSPISFPGDKAIPSGSGCCSPWKITKDDQTVVTNNNPRTASMDFGGLVGLMPYEPTLSDEVVIDISDHASQGRVTIKFDAADAQEMMARQLTDSKGEGTLEAQLLWFSDDVEVQQFLGGSPAFCQFMKRISGKDFDTGKNLPAGDMCRPSVLSGCDWYKRDTRSTNDPFE